MRGGDPQPALIARLARTDHEAWISVKSSPVLGRGRPPEAVVSTVTDITQSHEAEQRLIASERANRRLATEQAALRRVATLVAADPGPAAVFERVTKEVANLLEVPSANIVRYESDVRGSPRRQLDVTERRRPARSARTCRLDDGTVVARSQTQRQGPTGG